MKLCLLISLPFLVAWAPAAQQPLKPVAAAQVMDLVKAGMETPELVKLIHEHSIDFDVTDDYIQALRAAGAQEPVIEALRAARPKPLSKEQVLALVAGHVPSERAALLVKQRGIDFVADDAYFDTLRLAGADDTLITALRKASAGLAGELDLATSPQAVVFLDGKSQGQADGEGRFTLKASPGPHVLRVSLTGKTDFTQTVTFIARQTSKMGAALRDKPTGGAARDNSKDGLKYVWIPPGTFTMGCSPGDTECGNDEKPQHQVTLTQGFWLGQTEVTVAAYRRFATATGRKEPAARYYQSAGAHDNKPVVYVTWTDAQAYCAWAGGRLPTEAQWEYAARAGSTEARYAPLDQIAVSGSGVDPQDVAQKRPNAFGLFDMLGNVWEFVSDWYDADYYQHSPAQDPTGPASGQWRIIRSGSWSPSYLRASQRYHKEKDGTGSDIGLRCVWEPAEP